MDTYGLIAARRERQLYWAQEFLELDCLQSELLARSGEALWKSRVALEHTSQNAARPLSNGRHQQTLLDRAAGK
jgi:hypothetical protein